MRDAQNKLQALGPSAVPELLALVERLEGEVEGLKASVASSANCVASQRQSIPDAEGH